MLRRYFFLILGIAILAVGILYFLRFHNPQAIFPIRGEFVEVQGRKLYTTLHGEGQTVLFLHGFPYHSDTFNVLTNNPLPGYQFITLDLPGLGLSQKDFTTPPSPDDLALTVKLFLDKLQEKQVILVGHDLGGGVALICAALYPQLVQRLVLIAPDCSAGVGVIQQERWWRMPVLGELWATLRLDREFIRLTLQQAWAPNTTGWTEMVERYYRPLDTANGRQGFLNLVRGCQAFNYLPYEERLDTPCLVIWGEQDQVIPLAKAQSWVATLKNAQLQILSQVGHMPQEEAPDKVYELLRAFFPSVSASSNFQP